MEPKTVRALSAAPVIAELRTALTETRVLVDGIPSKGQEGLLDRGEKLAAQLRKIAAGDD